MTCTKGLYLAICLAFFALLSSQTFAQTSSSQPSQPIAPKSPLSLIVDQPDEAVPDTFLAKPDLSKPMILTPSKPQKSPNPTRGMDALSTKPAQAQTKRDRSSAEAIKSSR